MLLGITSLEVALAGVIGTAVVGVLASLSGAFIARGNREHERSMARDQRTWEAESAVYVDMLEEAHHAMLMVNMLHEWAKKPTEEDPGLPELPDSDRTIEVKARISAFGSKEVQDAYDRLIRAAGQFAAAPADLAVMRAGGPAAEKQLEESNELRKKVRAELTTLSNLVRDELRR